MDVAPRCSPPTTDLSVFLEVNVDAEVLLRSAAEPLPLHSLINISISFPCLLPTQMDWKRG